MTAVAYNQKCISNLEKGNEVRLERAKLKKQILDGSKTVPEVLREQPRAIKNMRVVELLASQWEWGAHTSRSFLNKHHVVMNLDRRCGELTERQIKLICWGIEDA